MSKKDPTTPQPRPTEIQGSTVDASNPDELRHALELAFNYRGDVTIARKSAGPPIEGYIFDIKAGNRDGRETVVRVIPKNSDERIAIPLSEIASVIFTGKDTASGKSFETWIKKYAEKKLAGEKASIESEPLHEE